MGTGADKPDAVRAATTLLALLLPREPGQRAGQGRQLLIDLPADWGDHLPGAEQKTRALSRPHRLQLIRELLPQLQQLELGQRELLLDVAGRLIRADNQVSLTEHLYLRMTRDALGDSPKPAAAAPAALRAACTLLLSLAARAGQHEDTARVAAYAAGVQAAPLDGLGPLLDAGYFSSGRVDRALDTLAGTTEGFRVALFRAVRIVAEHDDHIIPAELELLHAISLALGTDPSAGDTEVEPGPEGEPPPDAAALKVAATGSAGLLQESDWRRRDRIPATALVVANLVPLVGVLLFDWDVRYLLLLYWLENLVIGAFTLVRIFSTGGIKALGKGLFFSLHYGFFCAGHGVIVLALSSLGGSEAGDDLQFEEGDIPFLIPYYMLRGIFQWIAIHMPGLLYIPLLALIISHGISLLRHHFIGREDVGRSVDAIMLDPYPRIVILHLSILAGSFFVIGSGGGSAAPVLIILIAAKTWLDLLLHRRAHGKRSTSVSQ